RTIIAKLAASQSLEPAREHFEPTKLGRRYVFLCGCWPRASRSCGAPPVVAAYAPIPGVFCAELREPLVSGRASSFCTSGPEPPLGLSAPWLRKRAAAVSATWEFTGLTITAARPPRDSPAKNSGSSA